MVETSIWAGVALFFLILVNYRYGQWAKSRTPLGTEQYQELRKRIDELKNDISKLSLQRGYEDD